MSSYKRSHDVTTHGAGSTVSHIVVTLGALGYRLTMVTTSGGTKMGDHYVLHPKLM